MQFSVNGRYLLILDPDAVPEALDAAGICKHKNYGSFQRQCCIYGWRRIAQPEVPKLVLDDDEEPGATISLLGENIKVMQHENLVRDSPREEVRSVTRKAKPKPSRAKDAETRAVANERMAAEQAEREAKQQKQAELVALHRQEEKRRQEEQKRKEQMKLQQDEDEVNMDLTYDPALPPAPPMSSSVVLDPSLAGLTGSMTVSANTLGAAPTIPKQANSNTATGTKKSKSTSKKRKAAASAAGDDKGEDQENRYEHGDIRVNEEINKRAKKKQAVIEAPPPTTVTFNDIAAVPTLDIHADPFATVHSSTESASANFDNFFANAFDPSRFPAVPPTVPLAETAAATQQQPGVTSSSTQFEALPKSLQEAFLSIDNNSNAQNLSNSSSNSTTPNNASTTTANSASSVIDPALASFSSPSLPPLPAQPANNTQTALTYSNSPGMSMTSPVAQIPSQSTYGTMPGLDVNYGLATSLPSAATLPMGSHTTQHGTNLTSSFYYQPPPIDAFADPTYDPNLPPNNVIPPYFSSAFSGLADLQATNW